MFEEIRLGVYRRLDNRVEGLGDQSPRAVELHERRKRALHEVFDADAAWNVLNWGDTDDSRPHECVVLLLAFAGPKLAAAAVPALTFVGGLLIKSAVDAAVSEAIKGLIAKLRRKQEDKLVLDFSLTLPGGHVIRCDPPEQGNRLTVTWSGGTVQSVHYDATHTDIAKLGVGSA